MKNYDCEFFVRVVHRMEADSALEAAKLMREAMHTTPDANWVLLNVTPAGWVEPPPDPKPLNPRPGPRGPSPTGGGTPEGGSVTDFTNTEAVAA